MWEEKEGFQSPVNCEGVLVGDGSFPVVKNTVVDVGPFRAKWPWDVDNGGESAEGAIPPAEYVECRKSVGIGCCGRERSWDFWVQPIGQLKLVKMVNNGSGMDCHWWN